MTIFKIILFVVGLLCFFTKAIAQFDRADIKTREVLVFIMPDSLELATELKRGTNIQQSTIKSQQLQTTLASMNIHSIAKAFPDWIEADSITYSKSGERVKRPEFHRVFSLLFNSEQEADDAIKKLNTIPAVLYAEKNVKGTVCNDPKYLDGSQWHLKNDGQYEGIAGADIHAENAWNIFTGSSNITIAIFDTGVEISHDEFAGKASGDLPLNYALSYHGTRVAGMAIATANNAKGGRGLDWNAKIKSYRILDDGYFYGNADVATTIVNAVDQGCQILNHSWDWGTTYSSTFANAFAYAYKMNRVSVAAMGNTGISETKYPAALSNVIAVGSTTNRDMRSWFSTIGNHIDVVAPGGAGLFPGTNDPEDIFTSTIGNGYINTSGTSFATPLVSGLASLLKGYRNNLSNDDIRQIIRLSADKVSAMNGANFNTQYGYGRINAERALTLIRDNHLRQWTAHGGTIVASSNNYMTQFFSVAGLATGNYIVKRHEVQKTITFPEQFSQVLGIWGRGVGTSGFNQANPNFGEGFCEVIGYTTNSVTLRTYVYEVWDIVNRYLGCYPTSPANVTFAYTVLGNFANGVCGYVENFANQTVTQNKTVTTPCDINVQNVVVKSGATLILDAEETTKIQSIKVELGAGLKIQ